MYLNEYNYFNGVPIPRCMRSSENYQMGDSDSSESDTPEYQLGRMYPKLYIIVYPQVISQCDMFDKSCCCMRIPSNEEIEKMVTDICMNIEDEVKSTIKPAMREDESRQLGFGERGILGDLVRILILRELFDRRHRPHRRYFSYRAGY
ncbi:hypothetical protein [Clostridium oryzae]|uniref:Uncharacterized protein n=1 Tax=Clostridium oryzae TaxID=1450648 RepID=A0A1V4IGI8_9CLOT|nr:hypothetical protein [Clostridium oryzae]OPJ59111.1 hypothetical protein CLORY_34410 [Clostridium oryzae]